MSYRGGGDGSPWGNKSRRGKSSTKITTPLVKATSHGSKTAEEKFQEAHLKLRQMVQKHLEKDNASSSSEEDDLETENILDSVLKNYSKVGGQNEDVAKTQNFLENAFHSGAAVCLICIATVKRNDQIWSCETCYEFFHLFCIQRWAKDSVAHQKLAAEDRPDLKRVSYLWQCPKCRKNYESTLIPDKYSCFCGQKIDPEFHPWLVPHSCGDTCNKPLLPECGHRCLLLCHPGPCPPCPKMMQVDCFCGRGGKKTMRCSMKQWCCGEVCGRKLDCAKHNCASLCHSGPCPPCQKSSVTSCVCGDKSTLTPCSSLVWHCDKVCGRRLGCGEHTCERVCHSGACGDCPRSLPRACPCGKEWFTLPCSEEVATCGGTCSKLLDCGLHICYNRCHRGACGSCMEITMKKCRCGLFEKEVPCQKPFFCETKCKQMRDCRVHPCNRKCCDGNCPPCEKPCGKTLSCGQHKCASICHRGPCYPCNLTKQLSCRCAATNITVPCGASKRTSPPRCHRPCSIPPECHHESREPHRCHFGDCPRCKLPCGKMRSCGHPCTETCHTALLLPKEGYKPATPCEKLTTPYEVKSRPCPPCEVPVEVWCLGTHRQLILPCVRAKSQPCGDECGRTLPCGNHRCTLPCHIVTDPPSDGRSGGGCEECSSDCLLERACDHPCPAACHPPPCLPCRQTMRLRCHCGLTQLYLTCTAWTTAEDRTSLQSCGFQCPKTYSCGHRCSSNCHPGECPRSELCRKKVKISCSCKRIKKEVPCHMAKETSVSCDDACLQVRAEKAQMEEMEKEKARLAEERKNREELEKYERKLHGGKRHRERRKTTQEQKQSWISEQKYILAACFVIVISCLTTLFIYY